MLNVENVFKLKNILNNAQCVVPRYCALHALSVKARYLYA